MTDVITTPELTIEYMALRNAVSKQKVVRGSDEDVQRVHLVKGTFNIHTAEGKAFADVINKNNPNKLIAKKDGKAGDVVIKLASRYYPRVLDQTGELIAQEDAPVFYPGSSAKAVATIKLYGSGDGMGSVVLTGVGFTELNIAEKPDDGDEETTQETSAIISATREKLKHS